MVNAPPLWAPLGWGVIASLWRTWYVAAIASPLGPRLVASPRFLPWFVGLGGRRHLFSVDDAEIYADRLRHPARARASCLLHRSYLRTAHDIFIRRRYNHDDLRVRRNDFVAALVAAAGVLLAGQLLGLIVAVAQSLLGLVYRSSRVDVEVLGNIHGEKAAWGGIRNHPERTTVAGVLVLRLDSSLFWVNAAAVRDAILEAVDAAAELEAPKALVLDLESTDQLETTSADMLFALRDELAERGVDLYLVRVRWPVRRLLARSGLREALGEDHLWHNVAQGVREARRQHQLGGHRHPEPNVTNGPEAVIVTPTRPDDKQDGDARTEPG